MLRVTVLVETKAVSLHLKSSVAPVELVLCLQEGDEVVEGNTALLRDVVLVLQVVEGEGGEGGTGEQPHCAVVRVQHPRDARKAEVQIVTQFAHVFFVPCKGRSVLVCTYELLQKGTQKVHLV